MKYETFERANELRDQINYLYILKDLLYSAGSIDHPHLLAAICRPKFEDARNIVIKECEVSNHIKLQEDIKTKLIKVIVDEITKLEKEFDEL